MPILTVKLLEKTFSDEQKERLIAECTQAVVNVCGEAIRPHCLVLVEEVADGCWGAGGVPLTLALLEQRRAARIDAERSGIEPCP